MASMNDRSNQIDKREGRYLSRRGFVGWLMGFSLVATLAGVLTPIIGYLMPRQAQANLEHGLTPVGQLAEFPPNSGTVLPIANQPVIVTNPQGEGLKAFSAVCTHLGCVVHWHEAGAFIQCPCHDGRFNAKTGAVISGPPPRPLPPYELAVDEEEVYVGRPLGVLYGKS